jgi:hypothetical protein
MLVYYPTVPGCRHMYKVPKSGLAKMMLAFDSRNPWFGSGQVDSILLSPIHKTRPVLYPGKVCELSQIPLL